MRSVLVASLLVILLFRASSAQRTASRCYVLTWPDSVSQDKTLSVGALDSTRLQPDRTTVAKRRFYVVTPLGQVVGAKSRWKWVQSALWEPLGPDSIGLSIVTNKDPLDNKEWSVSLSVSGDSATGEGLLAIGDSFVGPYSIRGRRIDCPR
jgi:hypothetical protein